MSVRLAELEGIGNERRFCAANSVMSGKINTELTAKDEIAARSLS